jgi:hypothetical protein
MGDENPHPYIRMPIFFMIVNYKLLTIYRNGHDVISRYPA